MKIVVFVFFFFFGLPVFSQSIILLEICNKINNPDERLLCFKEVYGSSGRLVNSDNEKKSALNSFKKDFSELEQVTKIGVSYSVYLDVVTKLAMRLGSVKLELGDEDSGKIKYLEDAILAYKDAEILWRAKIHETKNGGIFVGDILNPEVTGLMGIVKKYNIRVESKLLNSHIQFDEAILKIFQYAEEKAKIAFAQGVESIGDSESKKPSRRNTNTGERCGSKYNLDYDPAVCE